MSYRYVLDDDTNLGEVAHVAKWLREALFRVMAQESSMTYFYDGEAVVRDLKPVVEQYEKVMHKIVEINEGTRVGGRYRTDTEPAKKENDTKPAKEENKEA